MVWGWRPDYDSLGTSKTARKLGLKVQNKNGWRTSLQKEKKLPNVAVYPVSTSVKTAQKTVNFLFLWTSNPQSSANLSSISARALRRCILRHLKILKQYTSCKHSRAKRTSYLHVFSNECLVEENQRSNCVRFEIDHIEVADKM